VFAFAKTPACALAMSRQDFERRRNLWFALTLTVFLAHNFWVYIVVAAVVLLAAVPRDLNKLAMFFFLLFAVPAIPQEITGLGIIDHFFTIDYVRLLALVVLFPAFLLLRRQTDTEPFGRSLSDKLLAGYLILIFVLQLRGDTLTNAIRHEVFYAFTDVFLPYYVASRSLRNLPAFRDTLMAFTLGALVLAPIGAFEFAKHWLLYTSLDNALGTRWYAGAYLLRGESLRALGTTQQPIVLGYVMTVAMGYFLYLRKTVPNPMAWGLGMAVLVAGSIAPISRGPWVGAAAIILAFGATGPNAKGRFAVLGLLGLLILPWVLFSSIGETIVDLMSFGSFVEASTIAYRELVLKNSMQLIMSSPFFGDANFLSSPLMQELRQGQGIIDIVNTFMVIGLRSGLIGLSLFCGFFLSVGVGIFRGMKMVADMNDERHLLGRALLATLLGIAVMIFAASSISLIPVVYWTAAGLGVGYARMLARAGASAQSGSAAYGPALRNFRA